MSRVLQPQGPTSSVSRLAVLTLRSCSWCLISRFLIVSGSHFEEHRVGRPGLARMTRSDFKISWPHETLAAYARNIGLSKHGARDTKASHEEVRWTFCPLVTAFHKLHCATIGVHCLRHRAPASRGLDMSARAKGALDLPGGEAFLDLRGLNQIWSRERGTGQT